MLDVGGPPGEVRGERDRTATRSAVSLPLGVETLGPQPVTGPGPLQRGQRRGSDGHAEGGSRDVDDDVFGAAGAAGHQRLVESRR